MTDILEPEKPKEESIGKYVHTRTIRQIATDIANKKETVPEKTELETKKEEIVVKKKEDKIKEREETHKKELEDISKKVAEETAAKVTEENKKVFDEKIQEILNKDKTLVEKQDEIDALIPAWEKEKRLPKDYKELIDENLRVTQTKWEQLDKERQSKKELEDKELAEKEKLNKAELEKKSGEEKLTEFNRQITQDLNDIYDAKMLPRPEKFEEINNPETKDEKAKETQKLLEFGVKLNTQLVKDGKPPVTSLAKIYFLHYKPEIEKNPPSDQPPGADAPVTTPTSAPAQNTTSKVNYKQLHGETWAQTKFRVMKEMAKSLVK